MPFDLATQPWWSAGLAALAVPALLIAGGRRDMLAYLAAYFLLFGFGPVASYLLGGSIYFGTNTLLIGRAAVGLLLAFAGVATVGLLLRQRRDIADPIQKLEAGRRMPLVPAVLVLLTLYGLAVLAWGGPAFLAGTKLDRIAVAGPFHYDYLLLQMCASALYFIAQESSTGRFAYRVNLGVYIAYCLATGERDFVFVLFALVLHRELVRTERRIPRSVLWGAALLLGATGLFALRGNATPGDSDATAILNQGSVLFVDTWVMGHVPSTEPYQHGLSYLHALLNLVPGQSQVPLAQWLVDRYAPGSSSGYGFSLTGEAYLNFGLVGIPVLFALLTAVHRWLVNRIDRAPVYAYASILFTVAWMYGFRGESQSLLKTCVYGALFFGVIRMVSARGTSASADDQEEALECASS
ncbi:O-antigen polysaccharide polymerase Wzy [Dactylosporangium sp. CS-033363]|uniref:O-antigen polysaccharide polymerase Wzy n=1 Tax=Dactylosporangium sp. CS-033363 TaxID=3239935 RepID=UPI003D908E3A